MDPLISRRISTRVFVSPSYSLTKSLSERAKTFQSIRLSSSPGLILTILCEIDAEAEIWGLMQARKQILRQRCAPAAPCSESESAPSDR